MGFRPDALGNGEVFHLRPAAGFLEGFEEQVPCHGPQVTGRFGVRTPLERLPDDRQERFLRQIVGQRRIATQIAQIPPDTGLIGTDQVGGRRRSLCHGHRCHIPKGSSRAKKGAKLQEKVSGCQKVSGTFFRSNHRVPIPCRRKKVPDTIAGPSRRVPLRCRRKEVPDTFARSNRWGSSRRNTQTFEQNRCLCLNQGSGKNVLLVRVELKASEAVPRTITSYRSVSKFDSNAATSSEQDL